MEGTMPITVIPKWFLPPEVFLQSSGEFVKVAQSMFFGSELWYLHGVGCLALEVRQLFFFFSWATDYVPVGLWSSKQPALLPVISALLFWSHSLFSPRSLSTLTLWVFEGLTVLCDFVLHKRKIPYKQSVIGGQHCQGNPFSFLFSCLLLSFFAK